MAKGNAPLYIEVADLERFAPGPVGPYLDGKTITDAVGRKWVSNDDAVGVLASAEAEWQAEIQRRSDHAAYLKDRQARRMALAAEIRDKVLAGGGGDPSDHGRASQAVREALTEFDANEPELDFYRWKDSRPTMVAAR